MIPLARIRKEYLSCRSLFLQVKPPQWSNPDARGKLARIAHSGPYYRVRREPDGRVLVFSRASRNCYLTDELGGALFSEALPGRPIRQAVEAAARRLGLDPGTLAREAMELFGGMKSCPDVPIDFPLSAPLRAGWRITERCNLVCRHCFNHVDAPLDMAQHSIVRVTEQLREAAIFEVIISGGEPLLHPELPRILERLGDMGIAIFTNGTLLEQRLPELAGFDLRFFISLDGFEQEHDALRGRGTWRRTMAGIEAAELAGYDVTLNCVVSALNLESVGDFVELHRSQGRHVQLSLLVPIGSAGESKSMELHLGERHRARLEALLGRFRSVGRPARLEENRFICGGGLTKVDIRADGRVVPCSFTTAFELGDLRESTLADLWSTPARGDFRAFLGPEIIDGSCRVAREAWAGAGADALRGGSGRRVH